MVMVLIPVLVLALVLVEILVLPHVLMLEDLIGKLSAKSTNDPRIVSEGQDYWEKQGEAG